MQIISRYVFRQAAGVLLLILLSLGGIVWIALALRELNVVTSGGQNAFTLLKMTTLALPNLLGVIAPFALLIAVVQVLSRLNGDSELIVLTASGATIWNVARPLLALAAIVSMAVSFVNHVGMPWSLRSLREFVVQMRTDLLTQVIQPGRFSSPESGLTFHIRDRSQNGELLGLIMQDQRKPPQSQAFLANRGVIVKQGEDAYLVMTDGHIINRNKPKEPPQIIVFDRYAVDLDQFEPKTAGTYIYKPRERYFSELMWPDTTTASFKKSAGFFPRRIARALCQPALPIRVRDDRLGDRGPGAEHATEPRRGGYLRIVHCGGRAHGWPCAQQHRCTFRGGDAAPVPSTGDRDHRLHDRHPQSSPAQTRSRLDGAFPGYRHGSRRFSVEPCCTAAAPRSRRALADAPPHPTAVPWQALSDGDPRRLPVVHSVDFHH